MKSGGISFTPTVELKPFRVERSSRNPEVLVMADYMEVPDVHVGADPLQKLVVIDAKIPFAMLDVIVFEHIFCVYLVSL